MKKKNHATVELSSELADQLVSPLIESIEIDDDDDQTARAIITMIRVVADEPDPYLRASFVDDIAAKIFARTNSCRHAAMAFAA
jgi:hypothetical protein